VPAFSRPRFHRRRFNIADFGTVGDGTTKNTAAFARAVAAAKRAHGGQIFVPAGTWLTGPIQITNNAVAGAPATAAAPIRNVHMNDFVITTDNTWNRFDSAYMQRFPAEYSANPTTLVSDADLAKLDTPVPGYQPSAPYGPGSTYNAKSCLDVCPIHMSGVHVTATVAGAPSLSVDRGTFSCVTTDVTECH
jgi:hypothetical protein